MARKTRRYETAWITLKAIGHVAIVCGASAASITAIRKGIQKEKYRDDDFRRRYPRSVITSVVSPNPLGSKVSFTLELNNNSTQLEDFGDPNE